MNNIKIFGMSDVGMVREKNEDSFIVFKTAGMDVAVVADGMGGHIGGQIASSTTVETIKNYFKKNGKKLRTAELIEDSLILSNSRIREKSTELPKGMSMGTTCTIAVIKGEFCYFGHIGDSKLYHIKRENITQISTDHTMLQRMLDSGALTQEDAKNYSHKNVIYRSVGGSEKFTVDQTEHFIFKKGEILLLCSDGLSGYVPPTEIFDIVKRSKSIEVATKYLINLAKYRGGDDNITVIIVEKGRFKRDRKGHLGKVPLVKRRVKKGSKRDKTAIFTLLCILIILLALLAFLMRDKIIISKNVKGKEQVKQAEKTDIDNSKPEIIENGKGEKEGSEKEEIKKTESDNGNLPEENSADINKEREKKEKTNGTQNDKQKLRDDKISKGKTKDKKSEKKSKKEEVENDG